MTVQRKQNIAGYTDSLGRFRPIRSPQFVGSPDRKATRRVKSQYSRAKAGDLGKRRQERALEDVFDREIRLMNEAEEAKRRDRERLERSIEKDIYGEADERSKGKTLAQFVRASGGIRVTKGDRGELEYLSQKESGRRGLIAKRGGKSLDGMFQAARESGYNVQSMDDLIDRLVAEAKGGKPMYKTHGYLDYRQNPSELRVMQITPKTYGVFLRKYLLKRFRTKAAAETYAASIRARVKKNPATAAKLAKAAIAIFDTDLDLDLDTRDVRRLGAGAKRLRGKKTNPKAKDPIREQFAKYLKIRGFDGYAKDVRNGADLIKVIKQIYGWEPPAFQAKLRQLEASLQKKNPVDPVGLFANAAVGIASALQIKEYMNRPKRKTPARRNNGGTNPAKRRKAAINPAKARGVLAKLPAGAEIKWNGRLFLVRVPSVSRQYIGSGKTKTEAVESALEAIKRQKNPRSARKVGTARSAAGPKGHFLMPFIDGVYLTDGESLGRKFKTQKAAREYASKMKIRLVNPPPKPNGVLSRAIARHRAGRAFKKELRQKAALTRTRAKKARLIRKASNPVGFKWEREKSKDGEVFYSAMLNGKLIGGVDKNVYGEWFVWGNAFTAIKNKGGFKTAAAAKKYIERVAKPKKTNPRSAGGKKAVRISANPSKVATLNRQIKAIRKRLASDDFETARGRSFGKVALELAKLEKTLAVEKRKERKAKANPRSAGVKKAVARSAKPNPRKIGIHKLYGTHHPICGKCERRSNWVKTEKVGSGLGFYYFCDEHKPKAKPNPKTTAKRRTYEMFQGRPASMVRPLPVSRFAPARMDQLGDLIEIKLADGQLIKPNPKRFKLCAAGGKLWIAGGTFAKPNPAGRTNELNPVEKIVHVVYGTRKPHHGDHKYTQYIHRLGEDSGHLPTLAVDREGFPIIRGGKYKIEARGIVN